MLERIRIRSAKSLGDAMAVRVIRNECRYFMTRDTSEIGVIRQWKWWTFMPPGVNLHVVNDVHVGRIVGYGILKISEGAAWMTAALTEEYRGQGLGRKVFKYLEMNAKFSGTHQFKIEVRRDNSRAIALYESLGYTSVNGDGSIITMVKP